METTPEKPARTEAEEVAELAFDGAPDEEIAEFVGVELPLLLAGYENVLRKARVRRRIQLRKKQTEVALDGAVSLLLFLGKHELGQNASNAAAGDRSQQPEPRLDPALDQAGPP